jgi:hypothetical protein
LPKNTGIVLVVKEGLGLQDRLGRRNANAFLGRLGNGGSEVRQASQVAEGVLQVLKESQLLNLLGSESAEGIESWETRSGLVRLSKIGKKD